MAVVPAFVIEYFLLGKTRHNAIERFTQDAGIVTDVWLAFGRDTEVRQRVLISPTAGTTTIDLAHTLHTETRRRRRRRRRGAFSPEGAVGVSPLENYVAASVTFGELIHVVLPRTSWWYQKNLGALDGANLVAGESLDQLLQRAILVKLGHTRDEMDVRQLAAVHQPLDRRILEASRLAAVIGVFACARTERGFFDDLVMNGLEPPHDHFISWVSDHAQTIAYRALREIALARESVLQSAPPLPGTNGYGEPTEPTEMIQRVFLDRPATLAAETEALCTIKADAAQRVFDVSCRNVAWAIIDSGIATTHPAFLDHDAKDRFGQPIVPTPHRIKATYDFTQIDQIRNFDLTLEPADSPARAQAIAAVVEMLAYLPGRYATPLWRAIATRNLGTIANQLDDRIPPDWSLIEPLIRVGDNDDGSGLVSDHGTHVAGILGADWRTPAPAGGQMEEQLQGVCPDIGLYDFRVIGHTNAKSTEFAVLAALEFVQYINARAGTSGPVIHGVNMSLSIPHDVRNYGCGATPICVACDRLVGAGVVVVAAAGNRGWNEQEIGFGSFAFCSITDPGNAQDVITVGATHRQRPHTYGVSYFSSRGANWRRASQTGPRRSRRTNSRADPRRRRRRAGRHEHGRTVRQRCGCAASRPQPRAGRKTRSGQRDPVRERNRPRPRALLPRPRPRRHPQSAPIDLTSIRETTMIFTLEVLKASEGDCLLLHWGTPDDPKLAVIDGGPGRTWETSLRPRLDELFEHYAATHAGAAELPIEVVMVSHVDTDHIVGIRKMFAELVAEADNLGSEPRPLQVIRLWHNTFNDIVGDTDDEYYNKLPASLTASVGGAASPDLVAAIEVAVQERANGASADDISLILAGHADGRNLRVAQAKLRDLGKIATLNDPFHKDGHATLITGRSGAGSVNVAGIDVTVIGPSEDEINELQREVDEYLTEHHLSAAAVLAAYSDPSVTNLSSIVCLVRDEHNTVLLTGDARGDKILAGLARADQLDANGRLHVDVLKVPHHGSDNNVTAEFFTSITAKTYVLSGNGKNGNPERTTIEWIVASHQPDDHYTLVIPYPISDVDKLRRAHALSKHKPWEHATHSLAALFEELTAEHYAFTLVVDAPFKIDLGATAVTW